MKPASAVEPAPGCPPALHYVSDDSPGYSRRILNDEPVYFDQRGKRLRDPETIRRINALAIPRALGGRWLRPDPGALRRAPAAAARAGEPARHSPHRGHARAAANPPHRR